MANTLESLHMNAGAEFLPYADVSIALTFGQPQAEYAAIRTSAAILDCPHRGILELSGRDRHIFLNNLLTNQTFDKSTGQGLAEGAGVYAFLLNNKGRIITDMNVIETGGRTLLELDSRMVEPTRQLLDKYLFAEQVKMEARTDSLHLLFITGPAAAKVLGEALGADLPQLPPLGCIRGQLLGNPVSIHRDDICGVPGYLLIIPAGPAGTVEAVWHHFADNPPPADDQRLGPDDMLFRGRARPIGWAAFNSARIEAGRPLFGVDFDDSVLPAETGQLARAVSFTKGCYLGQEIVARMHARGQLARQLVGIRMQSDALPIAGSKVYDDAGNEVGGITSSTLSPVLSDAAICLGYVRKGFIAPGSTLMIPAEGAMRPGTVVELPFVQPAASHAGQ
jgi:folate-binding protein YgfZ